MRSRRRSSLCGAGALAHEKLEQQKVGFRVGLFSSPCHPERSEGPAVRRKLLYFQLHQFRAHFSRSNRQLPHTHRQAETPGAGAPRIEIEPAAFLFHLRLMAVAAYDDAES